MFLQVTLLPTSVSKSDTLRAIFGGIVLWFVVESLEEEGRCYLYLLLGRTFNSSRFIELVYK